MRRPRTDAPGTAFAESGAIVITAPQLAEYLGVSPRRVRQMRRRDKLVTHGRGLIDASHAFNARIGLLFLAPEKAAELEKFRVAAVGWLMVRWSAGVTARDLADWRAMAGHCGLSPAEGRKVLEDAADLMGRPRPSFKQPRSRR